jgi:methylamine dehydrogenase heavy chain
MNFERTRIALNARWPGSTVAAIGLICFALSTASVALSALPSDLGTPDSNEILPTPPSHHWVWISDVAFSHMVDGSVHLVDGDSGRYLGMLSTGGSTTHVVIPHDGKLIYSPEIYFSRGTRGTRSDVVTIYDGQTLALVGEISIPPKRVSGIPALGFAGLTEDDRFLLIYNFNPGQSVSVVDTVSRTFVGEVETPGCTMAFPTGPRTFFSMCADASFLGVELDDAGHSMHHERTDALFDGTHDPVFERPVRVGDIWYFVSYDGEVHPIRTRGTTAIALPLWPLTSKEARAQGWRPSGVQQIAVSPALNRLYVLMRQGSRATHKDGGRHIWVYDLTTHRRVARILAPRTLGSIRVTSDADPLLFALTAEGNTVDVFAAASGKLLRSVKDVGTTPLLMVTP